MLRLLTVTTSLILAFGFAGQTAFAKMRAFTVVAQSNFPTDLQNNLSLHPQWDNSRVYVDRSALKNHLDIAKLNIVRAGDFKKANVSWAPAAPPGTQ